MAQINKPNLHFNTKLYSGNGSTNAVTGVGFAPDFVWIKERTSTSSHVLGTTIQGTGKRLSSNTADAEASLPNIFTSFDSDGFTHGADNGVNESGQTYVSWNWLGANGTTLNTDGSNPATISANTTSGFSIVAYTGTGSAATMGHGLGVTPEFIIIKNRTDAVNWMVYTRAMIAPSATNKEFFELNNNTNGLQANSTATTFTSTSNTTFGVGTDNKLNGSGKDMIAYVFAPKPGFSKFGKYTGNGNADGTFVYTGFKPAFVIIRLQGANSWDMYDNARSPYNPVGLRLYADVANADSTDPDIDFVSNGFKLRDTLGANNGSGNTYIYIAFAENPLVGTNNIPATAK